MSPIIYPRRPCVLTVYNSRVSEFVGRNFKLLKVDDNDAAEVARIFREAKKEDRQVWCFMLPSSLPIEVIEEQLIPLNPEKPYSTIMTQGNFDFTANHDGPIKTAISFLMPDKQGRKYKACK